MDRPSRSQQNLLEFIDGFVAHHGYGPSYREIMNAMDYKSVSTVAIHINGLVAKGQLRKHGRSARSLEVVKPAEETDNDGANLHEDWIAAKIEKLAAEKLTTEDWKAIARSMELLGLERAQAAATQKSTTSHS